MKNNNQELFQCNSLLSMYGISVTHYMKTAQNGKQQQHINLFCIYKKVIVEILTNTSICLVTTAIHYNLHHMFEHIGLFTRQCICSALESTHNTNVLQFIYGDAKMLSVILWVDLISLGH